MNDEPRERSDPKGRGDGWYYRATSGGHDMVRGPYSRQQILALLDEKKIDSETPVRWGNRPWRQISDYIPRTAENAGNRRRFAHTVIPVVCLFCAAVIYVGVKQRMVFTSTIVADASPAAAVMPVRALAPNRQATPSGVSQAQEALSTARIVLLTNNVRAGNGLPALEENSLLNSIAQERLQDMLNRQYFGHISPTGEGAADVAQKIGYRYRLIAENIAAGHFMNNQKVVDGWMQSPGHRKNILSDTPQHIGVAAAKGKLNGSETWVVVQIFGLPSLAVTAAAHQRPEKVRDPSCMPPSASLAGDIENGRARLSELINLLNGLAEELKDEKTRIGGFSNEPARTPGERAERSTFIASHNRKVERYNELLAQQRAQQSVLRSTIDEYNRRSAAYNECSRGI